ncbi:MAG: ABC transporter ATP-binding protein [Anaerolineales bacterium]|jgi:putative spermidine/putrescine transport system ATP-binding protein|uniref:ABC transporter ATP-binding protein n=1 Tax=Candidatus Villigracilis vicinus TaxID=3140679 RepID=UPI0031353B12|nr:ABC transporter ATP-binding protein [Anaerolineales bacterium]MBK7451719.1 ABC transporter ATP-binding protein [Anaerolineales bacterium]MBK9781598.1 ABC transporter ATP-binding protein [Anaerolineales bacterium]
MSETAILFKNVSRHFGEVKAVDNVELEIKDGEFFSMLGPSGSGKTTCLRMIAGFDRPTAGQIILYGDDVSNLPPYERPVNTVFQDYALFPHMSIEENIGYGLMIKGVSKPERKKRVDEMLELVQLTGFGARKPSQLSGGQRQRIALARALINHPKVLLLDEPLGALDLKLRQQMQVELKNIQREVGITFIFVTHDQEEALTMSDRIAVFSQGKIEQIGSPAEVYEHPSTPFVAGFVGTSNLVSGETAERITGSPKRFSVRPEKIHLAQAGDKVESDMFSTDGTVRDVVYLGLYTRYLVEMNGGGDLVVVEQNLKTTSMDVTKIKGQSVRLFWKKDHVSYVGG